LAAAEEPDCTRIVSLRALGDVWHVMTVMVDLEEDVNEHEAEEKDFVKSRPDEHDEWT